MDSTKLDPLVLELEKVEKRLDQQCIKIFSKSKTSGSDTADEKKLLSHAEESAIEECLNDTVGSLSSVYLKHFEDISDDIHVPRSRKTRTQRTSESVNVSFNGNGTDCDSSPLDELETSRKSNLTDNVLANPMSMIGVTRKSNLHAEKHHRVILIYREAMRSKRKTFKETETKKLSVIKKNGKTHIYSFFSAMADLVSTLPDEYEIRAKQNVNVILEEVVDKFKDWHLSKYTNNPKDGEYLLRILQYRITKLQKMELIFGVFTQVSVRLARR